MDKDYLKQDVLDNVIDSHMMERDLKRQPQREKAQKKRENKARRKERLTAGAKKMRNAFIAAVAVLLIVAALLGSSLMRISDLKKEKDSAQAQLDALTRKIGEMEYELTRVTSDEYIEQQARMKLRMIKPDEVLYVIE